MFSFCRFHFPSWYFNHILFNGFNQTKQNSSLEISNNGEIHCLLFRSFNFVQFTIDVHFELFLTFFFHCKFILQSQIWKTLYSTYIQQERNPIVYDLNPKCMSNNELFGFINSATREWKDGLLSSLIRDQAKYANDNPKWIAIDG